MIHIWVNITRSKGNQTKKFGQITEYNKGNIFPKKACKKCVRETSCRPAFVFNKALIELKANGL